MKKMEAGDIIISKPGKNGWSAVKILAIDSWPSGDETFHCLSYCATAERPTPKSADGLEVSIYHAPIAGGDFRLNWEVLCSPGVENDDLVGFIEYLKLTDFSRYVEMTGVNLTVLTEQALQHYKAACTLGDQELRAEAIAEYDKAIDLFPLFFEAIDNRAFTYMELGRFEEAILGFEDSLRVNPDGHAAFFSRGECMLKLEKYDDAEAVFREGEHRFPEHQSTYNRFREIAQLKKRAALKKQ